MSQVLPLGVQAQASDSLYPGEDLLEANYLFTSPGANNMFATDKESFDYVETTEVLHNLKQVQTTTKTCTQHRGASTSFIPREEDHCDTVETHWDTTSGEEIYTLRTTGIQKRILQSGYDLYQTVFFQTPDPARINDVNILEDIDMLRPYQNAWILTDTTSNNVFNQLLQSNVPLIMTDRINAVRHAAQPLFGWTQTSNVSWTTTLVPFDTWSPLDVIFPMYRSLLGIDYINDLEYQFTQSSGLTATLTISDSDTTFVITGTNNRGDAIATNTTFRPGYIESHFYVSPQQSSKDNPKREVSIIIDGHNFEYVEGRIYPNETSMDLSENIDIITRRRTTQNIRPIEQPVRTPTESTLALAIAAPQYQDCQRLQFHDICNHWSLPWLMLGAQVNYFGVDQYAANPPNLLMPDHSIQRSEFAQLIRDSRILDTVLDYSLYPSLESQVPTDADPNAWYMNSIQTLLRSNIAFLQEGGRFRPNDTLNRAEVMTFLARIIDGSTGGSQLQETYNDWRRTNPNAQTAYFSDVPLEAWYAPYIVMMAEGGIIDVSQPRYRPGDAVTRAEAITLLERVRKQLPHFYTSKD